MYTIALYIKIDISIREQYDLLLVHQGPQEHT